MVRWVERQPARIAAAEDEALFTHLSGVPAAFLPMALVVVESAQ